MLYLLAYAANFVDSLLQSLIAGLHGLLVQFIVALEANHFHHGLDHIDVAGFHKTLFHPKILGRFRRIVTLPDDVDPNAVDARYRDGVLRISIARKQSAQARRITIQ